MKSKRMKQTITVSQLNELTSSQLAAIQKEWDPRYGDLVITKRGLLKENAGMIKGITDPEALAFISSNRTSFYPVLSIGGMMELLSRLGVIFSIEASNENFSVISNTDLVKYRSADLCDALWAAVKKHLQEGRRHVG